MLEWKHDPLRRVDLDIGVDHARKQHRDDCHDAAVRIDEPAGPGRIPASAGGKSVTTSGATHFQNASGSELFRFDESSGRWTAIAPWRARFLPQSAFWTGRRLLVSGYTDTGSLAGGIGSNAWYDPATNRFTLLTLAGLGPSSPATAVWAGAALWTCSDCTAGPESGSTSVYNPATNTSASLAHPPLGQFGSYFSPTAPPVWTGTSALVYSYGQLLLRAGQPNPIAGFEYTIG